MDHNFRLVGTRGTIETDMDKPWDNAHFFARLSDVPGSIDGKIDIPVTVMSLADIYAHESAVNGSIPVEINDI